MHWIMHFRHGFQIFLFCMGKSSNKESLRNIESPLPNARKRLRMRFKLPSSGAVALSVLLRLRSKGSPFFFFAEPSRGDRVSTRKLKSWDTFPEPSFFLSGRCALSLDMASRKEAAGAGSSSVGGSKAKGKGAPGDSAVKQVQIDGLVSFGAGKGVLGTTGKG